jgi:hypothetical protein
VAAGETETIEVQYEYAEDFATNYAELQDYEPQNLVSVQSHHVRPGASEDNHPRPLTQDFGAQVRVFAGFKTDMDLREPNEEHESIVGDVWRLHDGSALDTGDTLVTVHRSTGETDFYREQVDNGNVEVPVDLTDWTVIDVQYLGMYPNNPTDIRRFER